MAHSPATSRSLFQGAAKDTGAVTRRTALWTILGAGAGLALAGSLPYGNDAQAQDRQAAHAPSAVQMADEMDEFSRDPQTQGIGVFINLQANAPVTGDKIGQWLQRQFATITPPVPVDYRVHQSRGTATDITFYVRGYGFTVNVGDLRAELPQVLAHHRGAWLPEQAALNRQPG